MSKVTKKLFENFQQLDEGLLTSDFTFGFELEAVLKNDSDIGDDIGEEEDSYRKSYDGIMTAINDILEEGMPSDELKGESSIHYDESVRANGDDEDDEYDEDTDTTPFEYGSKVFPCTPKWFNQVIKSLKYLMTHGIFTNDTCGFHHHLHFKGMTERDMVWIYCNMASDSLFRETFENLDNVELYHDRWASYGALKTMHNVLEDRNWPKVLEELNTRKWKAFRIHPQGTLEWRGPRDFMNHGNISKIHDFYMKFNRLIGCIKQYMNSNTLIDMPEITREVLFTNLKKAVETSDIKPDLEFISHTETYDSGTKLKYKTEKGILSADTADKLGRYFYNNIETFINKVINKDQRLGKVFKYFTVGAGNGSAVFGKIVNNAFKELENNPERKTQFSNAFIDILKNSGISERDFDDVISNYDLEQYLSAEMIQERLLNCRSLFRWGQRVSGLASVKSRVSIGIIEQSLLHIITTNNAGFDTVIKELLKKKFIAFFGEETIAKILVWLANSTPNPVRIDCWSSSLKKLGLTITKFIESQGKSKLWDKGIKRLMHSDKELIALLCERPSLKELISMVSKDSTLYNMLTDEEKEQIKSYGIDLKD